MEGRRPPSGRVRRGGRARMFLGRWWWSWVAAAVSRAPKQPRATSHPRPAPPITSQPRQVIAGEDKGAVGEVEKVLTKRGLVVIKGVNIKVGGPSSPHGFAGSRLLSWLPASLIMQLRESFVYFWLGLSDAEAKTHVAMLLRLSPVTNCDSHRPSTLTQPHPTATPPPPTPTPQRSAT